MKILTKQDANFDKSTQQLLKLLEHNTDFEKAVWTARANLGIKPSNLLYPQELLDGMKDIFEKAWQTRKPNPTVDEIHQITARLDNLPDDEFKKAIETPEGQELTIKVGLEEHKFEERLFFYSVTLLEGFVLPKNWIYPIMNLVKLGVFATTDSTGPFSLYVDPKWLRKKAIVKSDTTNLIPYMTHEPEGIQIVISNKIKHKNELDKWITDSWDEIKKVMELAELPEYWAPNLSRLDQTLGIMELQKEHPEKSLGEIISIFEANLSEGGNISDQSISKEIQQFKEYVERLTVSKRKNS